LQLKKRILLCNEASYLNTGFATYGLELFKRLYATGKYELAEQAIYGPPADDDPRALEIPWKYYPNAPSRHNKAAMNYHDSKPSLTFGELRFEQTCLEFKPDVVIDIRDFWMLEFEQRSPFRPYFHWAIMPTVDAVPQEEEWISGFINADAVFSYSDWGIEVLRKEGNGHINAITSAPPGANLESYKIIPNKKAHRASLGLQTDIFIIGTVMRNQRRKLYPDLIEAFSQFLKDAPSEIGKKTFLYCHTAYPDQGWDIPSLIKEHGVSNKVIFTYCCQNCGLVFPSFYQDPRGVCGKCGQATAKFPTTRFGVDTKTLGNIMGLFDVYVQYATNEGFGLPMVEAAACGVPVMAVDYSAMSDVVRKLNGYPIKVQRMFREPNTNSYRALPENKDLVDKLKAFFSLPESMRMRKGYMARQGVELNYTWERTAKIWENYLDTVPVKPVEQTWLSPMKIHQPQLQGVPPNLTNEEFAKWAIVNIAGRPDLLNSYLLLRLIRDLNWGHVLDNKTDTYFNELSNLGIKPIIKEFSRQDAVNELLKICDNRNFWEKQRDETQRK
jgi:glycosyltransferase involved in cell wall biosynthesis